MIDIGRAICKLFHEDFMFAGGKFYECRTCLRRFEVPWAQSSNAAYAVTERRDGVASSDSPSPAHS